MLTFFGSLLPVAAPSLRPPHLSCLLSHSSAFPSLCSRPRSPCWSSNIPGALPHRVLHLLCLLPGALFPQIPWQCLLHLLKAFSFHLLSKASPDQPIPYLMLQFAPILVRPPIPSLYSAFFFLHLQLFTYYIIDLFVMLIVYCLFSPSRTHTPWKHGSLLKLFSDITQASSITPGTWSMLSKYFFE